MKINLVLFTDKVEMSILNLYHRLINTIESVYTDIYIGIYNANFDAVKSNYTLGFYNIAKAEAATHGRVPNVNYVNLKRTKCFMERFNKVAVLVSDKEGYTYFVNENSFISNSVISNVVHLEKSYDLLMYRKYILDNGDCIKLAKFKPSVQYLNTNGTIPLSNLVISNKILKNLTKTCSIDRYSNFLIQYNICCLKKLKVKYINSSVTVRSDSIKFDKTNMLELQEIAQLVPNKKLFPWYWYELLSLQLHKITPDSLGSLATEIQNKLKVTLVPTNKRIRELNKLLKKEKRNERARRA